MISRLLAVTFFCVAFSIAFFATNASANHLAPDTITLYVDFDGV